MKQAFICTACGMEYAPAETPPERCILCEDDRQYLPPGGQQWTTMEALTRTHGNVLKKEREGLYALYTTPSFAIGQRAHLIITPGGNILWDCIACLDAATIDLIKQFGGIRAICISHPHYYTSLVSWSSAFADAPVYLHARDRKWIGWETSAIRLWRGESLPMWDGISLIRLGGHFPGGNILYWPDAGALLTGDILQVCANRKTVSCMYSYPNLIPLPEADIRRILERTASLRFDSVYGAFGRNITGDGARAVNRSLRRYLSLFK